MQLVLRTLDLSTVGFGGGGTPSILVRAFLNGTPTTAAPWTNAVGNVPGQQNSSLAQIADYANVGISTVNNGEVIAGFFVGSGAQSIDLSGVRDLGNSIIGGGGTTTGTNIYPDGPDTLTIVATNLSSSTSPSVVARLSWTEAQA
jgi:hypothetical protein